MVNEKVNSDEVEKLEPENDNEQMLVNALLAKCRGVDIEMESLFGWSKANGAAIFTDSKYRIKPKATPLPIPDELWKLIKPEFKYIAIDEDGELYLYKDKPIKLSCCWDCDVFEFMSFITVNTDGIDWRLSLTERPEGL